MYKIVSTTSVVAVVMVFLGFGLLYAVTLLNLPHDNTRATQVITGTYGLMMAIVGYYFGASKSHTAPATGAPAIGSVDTVNVNTAPIQPDPETP